MKTKTVTVTVQIQMDIRAGENDLSQVQDALEEMNNIIASNVTNTEPQIFVSDISGADIFDVPKDEDED
jgi:hypothetical protein